MTSKDQLLDALDKSRESLLMAIESLPDEALNEKQTIDNCSVSDVLVNITAWEAELVTGLLRIQQNKRPDKLLAALKNPDYFDKQRLVENQDRNLDQIFNDLQLVRVQVEEWILEFSESELVNPKRYRWLKGQTLKDIIARATFERELEVVPQLERFAQKWVEHEVNTADGIIPLTAVNLNMQEYNHDAD